MSQESSVRIVELPKIGKHPNADTLSIVQVQGGYPCIFKSGNFVPGDKAVYIPVDSIVPEHPAFAFLEGHNRIKARRLRGIFSMGLLIPLKEVGLPDDTPVNTIVGEQLGITKWEPQIDPKYWQTGDAAPDPGCAPEYDVEGMRMYPNLFDGKQVSITEKIHGTNFRAVWHDGKLHIGGHRTWRKKGPNLWWNVAQNFSLEDKLRDSPFVLYGEVYGPKVQDLTYGAKSPLLVFYDVRRKESLEFLTPMDAYNVIGNLGLPFVPFLFEGAWTEECKRFAEGESPLAYAHAQTQQIREGMVVRPMIEQFSPELGGRLILKLCGEQYYLRKEK